jgi:uncharacterized protein (DUF2062 family)
VFRRLWEKLKLLWKLAKSERAAPREIGWAVAIGAFAGCSPAVGVHGWVAVGLATLFRKNRMFSWIGSRISNVFFLPFIVLAEIQVSHRVRTGAWMDLDRRHVVDQAPHLLLDWCLGSVPVGAAIAIALGLLAFWLARRRDARAERAERARADADAAEAGEPVSAATPAQPRELPPPSSGSRA